MRTIVANSSAEIIAGISATIQPCGTGGRDAKTKTKLSKYNASGITQNSGTAARSLVTNAVTASRCADGTAARMIHHARRRSVGRGAAPAARLSIAFVVADLD